MAEPHANGGYKGMPQHIRHETRPPVEEMVGKPAQTPIWYSTQPVETMISYDPHEEPAVRTPFQLERRTEYAHRYSVPAWHQERVVVDETCAEIHEFGYYTLYLFDTWSVVRNADVLRELVPDGGIQHVRNYRVEETDEEES